MVGKNSQLGLLELIIAILLPASARASSLLEAGKLVTGASVLHLTGMKTKNSYQLLYHYSGQQDDFFFSVTIPDTR